MANAHAEKTTAADVKASRAKRWKRVPGVKRYRFWRPEQIGGAALYGVILAREEKKGRYGEREHFVMRATEDSDDSYGAIVAGDTIAVGEATTLAPLAEMVGREVRITPAGFDGKVKLYDIEVAE